MPPRTTITRLVPDTRPSLRRGRLLPGLVLLASCLLLTGSPVAYGQENEDNTNEQDGVLLQLPENWQILAAYPDGTLRLGLLRENEALLKGGAVAQAEQAFTLFSLTEMPPAALDLPDAFTSQNLMRLNRNEQDQLRARLEKHFTAELQRLTPFSVEQLKTMLNNMNGQDVIMLTARCGNGDAALIVNQVYYFPPARILILNFVSPTDVISFIAPDIAFILEHFSPEAGAGGKDPL